jgi:SIR2-like domain
VDAKTHTRQAASAAKKLQIPDDLARSVRERRAILFAGAGLSMCVGLPSWRMLIEHMTEELKLDPKCVEDTNYQTLAEYYRLKQGSIGTLRSWMDRNWNVPEEQVRASVIHRLIVELDFPIIYTTNYDRNLEVAFQIYQKNFVKVANAKDIAKIEENVTQIVKYHGDFDDDNSLVLAETDYFKRLAFDSPLDIKFRADALGRTILFIGYSMSDTNIRLLLHRLWETWARSGHQQERPQSYAFTTRRDEVQEAVLGRWGISALTSPDDDPQEGLRHFLQELKIAVEG